MPRWKKLAFGVINALLVLAIIEGGIRLTPLEGRLSLPTPARDQALHLSSCYALPALVPSPRTRPGDPPGSRVLISSNGAYRRNRVVMPKPRRTFRLVILGDSTAWGVIAGIAAGEANQAYTLPRSLGWNLHALLAEELRPWRVDLVNLSLPGTISEFTLRRAQEALTLEPDAVIIYTGINDTNGYLVSAMLDPRCGLKGPLRRASRILDLAAILLTRPHFKPPADTPDNDQWRQMRGLKTYQNIEGVLRLARAKEVPVYVGLPVVAMPDLYQDLDLMLKRVTLKGGGTPVNLEQPLRRAAAARGVAFASMYSSDGVHPNPGGYKVMAAAFFQAMEETILGRYSGRGNLPERRNSALTRSSNSSGSKGLGR